MSLSTTSNPLSDDLLLKICRASPENEGVKEALLADLRFAASLIAAARRSNRRELENAVTLLAERLAQLPQFNPTHLPFGYEGPTIRSHSWMDRDDLEQVAKQLVGLIWDDADPDVVAYGVSTAVAESVRLGFMDQKKYDAWRPGMPSGSGWRTAVTATPLGIAKARSGLATAAPASKATEAAAHADDTKPRGAVSHGKTTAPADEVAQTADHYNWASQAEVWRALQNVLGEEAAPDKATISRAVQRGHLQTNGKSGRACLINVGSLKSWIAKWAKIDTAEAHQVLLAVIAEIDGRQG